MTDVIEKIGSGSIIQHGKLNDRIYLMKLHKQDYAGILDQLVKLAQKNAYTKLFCKVPGDVLPEFINSGFNIEATIPGFYNGQSDVFFMAKYYDDARKNKYEKEQLALLSALLRDETPAKHPD